MSQHILLTGGNGYIASHTAIELLKEGYKLTLLDNFCNSSRKAHEATLKLAGVTEDRMFLCEADLIDKASIESVFEKRGPFDAVIHFGALKSVGESWQKPLLYYQNNLTGTFNLLEVMNKFNCKKIIFSSSATVYGADPVPITEDSPVGVGISNPYGRTKYMMEQVLTDLTIADKEWSVILLRYFNPVGAHESGDIGESPNGIPNNLMPYIQQVAIGRRPFLSVFGDDYDTPDGTGVRDYIHIFDLAQGHLKAIQYLFGDKKSGTEVFNLGTGHGYSVLEMLHAMVRNMFIYDMQEEVCGHEIPYKIVPRRAGDIATCFADPAKAKAVLGWEAVKSMKDMCADAMHWQSKHPYGFDDAPEN